MSGNAWVMLPNPRYDPHAPEQVVEHLLLAARGGDPGDETSYFSGRVAPLARLVDWVQTARPGIFVVTGPAGSGKSALVGRLVSLSNPTERARLLAQGPVEHADPGERSVHAHVHVRGSTVERLVQELDDQLVRAGVLSPHPGGPRNRGDLLGALERSPIQPVIVIDGLDEAAQEAWQISSQVLSLLAGNARIIVATRDLAPAEDGPAWSRRSRRRTSSTSVTQPTGRTQQRQCERMSPSAWPTAWPGRCIPRRWPRQSFGSRARRAKVSSSWPESSPVNCGRNRWTPASPAGKRC